MTFSWERVAAIVQKELRDYRRNRFVVLSMSALPLLMLAIPIVQLFAVNVSSTSPRFNARIGLSLLYMLILPAIVPSVLSAYSVVGEREQGTLEPILTTPIHREEFLIGKALAVLLPTLVVAYLIFGIFLGTVAFFAHPAIASAIFERARLLVQLLFTPLVAGWSIWAGIAVSTRLSDVRAAQQVAIFASLPPLVVRRGFDSGERFSSATGFGDDLFGGLVPDKGLWIVVPVLGPGLDGIDQSGHAREAAAA